MSDDVANTSAADAASVARGLKLVLVSNPERANDVYPTLIASRGGEVVAMCDLREGWADRDNVLRDAVAVLAPDDVVLVVETFVSLTPTGKPADLALSERFRDGDPTVSEAIDVLQMTSSGEALQVFLPYSYVGGALVWREPQHVGSPGEPTGTITLEGDIPDALRAGFAAAGKHYDLDGARAALKSMGVRVRFAADPNPFVGVGPSEPCPCGSKRMLQDCHFAHERAAAGNEPVDVQAQGKT